MAMECRLERTSVHYEARGEGRPLLTLHGFTLDHRVMVEALEPVFRNRAGWRRLYPDLPGMGQSEAPDWIATQDEMLEVLVELVDRLMPGERFSVVGLSWGGFLAQGLVHRLANRMDGLCLIVPSMGPAETRELPPGRALHAEPIDFGDTSAEDVASFRGMAVVQTQEQFEIWKRTILPAVRAADANLGARLRRNYAFSFDPAVLARPFEKPALFVHGRQDNDCGYRDAWKVIESYPRATYAVLDRAGHCLDSEAPRLLEALVHDWLDRIEEEAADRPA
jgi:pimeloyl-ACP methyl ester carboxylesterase